MAKDSRRGLPKDIPYADASHPIFSNPTVIGSRANLMKSMPKAVDASEETEEDGPLDEPDKKSTTQPSEMALPKEMIYPDASDPIYSNPTVIGSRANLMRSRPKAVAASKGTTASPSTPSPSETDVGLVTAISYPASPEYSFAVVGVEGPDGERVRRSMRVDALGTLSCEGVNLRVNDRIRYAVSHAFRGIIVWFEVLEPAEPEEMEDPSGPESPNKKAL